VPRYDYTTVGHVTIDVLDADGSRRPGGTAFYSALQAARLGLRTLILTRGVRDEIETLLAPYRDELDLEVIPAEHTTTLQTAGEGHERRQRLLAWAGPIAWAEPTAGAEPTSGARLTTGTRPAAGARPIAEPLPLDTAILHLAPVARETPRGRFNAHQPRAELVGLTPQGLVREWDATGKITLGALRPELLPKRCDVWVLSERERECCAAPAARAVAEGTVMAVTAGAHPTELQLPGGELLRVPASPIAAPVDDLGAGDVFAAAFFIALREGHAPAGAAAFAGAAAAVRIAGAGPGAIGDRRAIEARLGQTRREEPVSPPPPPQ
jgi:sugar/nucleoside kinase (ribokinase family)